MAEILTQNKTEKSQKLAKQKIVFKSGNEMAALAAKDINFHVMGYYPITPCTEVAENLDEMRVEGEHEIAMIPGDGEHGAAGICYGATLGGGRVLNVTSAQGLLYSLEQLPVLSGTRYPMVLNIATRSINGPLDIRGDHSDIYFALNCGWIILMARDAQSVYDFNIISVRIGEHKDIRLPVIVAYDGFFTSHQKRRVSIFENSKPVRDFIGIQNTPYHALDPKKPITIGPYMNDPDLINNKYQVKLAFDAVLKNLPIILKEYGEISGRYYSMLDLYRMEDAEAAIFIVNSAAETAKEVADKLRKQGVKVGVVSPNVIRPFPVEEIKKAFKNVKAVLIADRGDSYGAFGGNMSLEVRAALKEDSSNKTLCISRIYGLGGRDFYAEDAEEFFKIALESAKTGKVNVSFDYYGAVPGSPEVVPKQVLPPLTKEEVSPGITKVTKDSKTGRLNVELTPFWNMVKMPSRIAPGHGACPGCGIFPALHQFFRGIEGHIVVLYQTGCAMVVTTGYPKSSHRVTYIHNLFQNGSATLSGLVEMYHERIRRGELAPDDDITFIMISGDGGMDIGMGPTIGTANRNHKMIIIEYDNQGYMNTGSQLSYSTPFGHKTSTSNVGPKATGKLFHHKDTVQIMAATHIPYVFAAVEGYPDDLIKKAAKAQWYAKNEGLVYGKILSFCPLNWGASDDSGTNVMQAAVDSCFFPMYEIEKGKTTITYNPEAVGRRIPIGDWFAMMAKTKHLIKPENKGILKEIENEVERRWKRLNAMHEHPYL